MSNDTIGREPIRIIEIVQPMCSLSYGEGACTAGGRAECFNTRKTCQAPEAYDETNTVCWRFCSQGVKRPPDTFEQTDTDTKTNPVPALLSAQTSPSEVNIGGTSDGSTALGTRATLSITMQDFKYDDKYADPYLDQRDYDAYEAGTFFTKYLARNPYYINDTIRIYDGYRGETLDEMLSREYLIETISNPNSSGQVSIKGKDPLRLTDAKRTVFPFTSYTYLYSDITETQTSGIQVTGTLDDLTANILSSAYYMAISSEAIRYTGVTEIVANELYELTGVTRAALGTEADSAEAGDGIQRVGSFEGISLPDVLKFLLSSEYGASIDENYLDYDSWVVETSTYATSFTSMTSYIFEPDSIQSLVSKLCNECSLSVWWDERDRLIKIRYTRPPTEVPEILSEESNFVEGSFSVVDDATRRISRVTMAYSPFDWSETGKLSDFRNIYYRIDAESEEFYEEERNKVYKCIWVTTDGQSSRTGTGLTNLFSETPKISSFTLDAKDCRFWVADIVDVRHRSLTNAFGGAEDTRFFIISAVNNHLEGTLTYKAISFSFLGNFGTIMANDAPSYPDRTANYGMWISNSDGLYSNGDEGYKIQ